MRKKTWYWSIWWWFGYHWLYQINWWWKSLSEDQQRAYTISIALGILFGRLT